MEVVVLKGPDKSVHTHALSRDLVAAEQIKENIKKKAEENPILKPSVIIRDELAGRSGRVLANLPERENLKISKEFTASERKMPRQIQSP